MSLLITIYYRFYQRYSTPLAWTAAVSHWQNAIFKPYINERLALEMKSLHRWFSLHKQIIFTIFHRISAQNREQLIATVRYCNKNSCSVLCLLINNWNNHHSEESKVTPTFTTVLLSWRAHQNTIFYASCVMWILVNFRYNYKWAAERTRKRATD